jgi:hypothetical protein
MRIGFSASETVSSTGASHLQQIALERLRPDWENPRFPPGSAARFSSDLDVYVFLDSEFDAFAIADSIAEHGFFESEPLIAIPGSGADYIVVEGNRRLAALRALADPAIRKKMADPRWRNLPKEVDLPAELPVLVAESRDAVAPILGYRHITGIAPWSPYQQARFVSSLIDNDGMDADRVAELVGRSVSEVRAFYRNYSIVEQGQDVFKIRDVDRLVSEFGVWTRTMTSAGAREYIRAPAPRDVVEGEYPLPDGAKPQLENLVQWVFGAPRTAKQRRDGTQSRAGRAIKDSRQITRLGKALQHPKGMQALEAGGNLEDAERAMLDNRAQFGTALSDALQALETALQHKPRKLGKNLEKTLSEIEKLTEKLRRGNGDSSP